MTYPEKLKPGDEIRVITPSASLAIPQEWNTEKLRNDALKKLNDLGFTVSFGKYVNECDEFMSSAIEKRADDLHEAFSDKNVKMILCAIGGFNANQLLRYLDYSLIKLNTKIFCGYSDITVLTNAILKKSGLVTYSGPHYTTFGCNFDADYIVGYFKKCVVDNRPYNVMPSDKWSDFKGVYDNTGYWTINEGGAEGMILGGNLSTFNQLHGTEYMPDLNNSILYIEDDSLVDSRIFDRDLQSLIHQSGFENVKGIVIGRFQPESNITKDLLVEIIKTKKELNTIPVIANADFGHTKPLFTFPIGGKTRIKACESCSIEILEH